MDHLVRNRSSALSRRRFLRGAGVAMALPWLESVPVWGATAGGGKATGAAAFPKRFAAVFMANGVNAKHWWARPRTTPGGKPGNDLELGKSLEPMAPLKAKMNLVNGLFNEAATKVGIHPPQTGNLLSGARLQKGAELKGDISVDQMLANHLGQDTVQPSMVLGCETPTTGYHETNYSLAYSSHISWQNATTPVPLEQYPALAFDALFDNRNGKRNQSILDLVKEQAATLNGQVSAADRAKLDEYLTSVREVEKRIAGPKRAPAPTAPVAAAPMKRPADGLPEDIREHMRLMCDLVALGFQTDHTRVATLLLCRDLSGLTYPFLDIRKAHHPASHADTTDDYEKITRFYVGHFAYLASRLDAMKEGPGSVLDNSCLMFVSNMWSGSKHDATKLPVLLAGSLGGTLKTGRALDYEAKGDENRRMCSLYLSIMDRMGVVLPRFGDAETRLAGI
jgi:hypothetical protein